MRGKRGVLSLLPVGGREGEREREGGEKEGERDLTLCWPCICQFSSFQNQPSSANEGLFVAFLYSSSAEKLEGFDGSFPALDADCGRASCCSNGEECGSGGADEYGD